MKISFIIMLSVLLGFQSSAQLLDTVKTFDLEKMSRKVNTSYHEGGPVISSDGNTLYFFRTNHPRNRYGSKETQDIWYSKRDTVSGLWGEALHMSENLNRYRSNQVFAIVNGGKSLLVTGSKNAKNAQLAICTKSGSDWGKPVAINVQDLNKMSKGRYYGATMTDDQSVIILYFSEKDDSRLSDLYMSKRISAGSYTKPVKLGLSTAQDDLSPFICDDNKTLYYSSGGKGTHGSVDIREVKRLDDSWLKWSKPKNMGKPLNSRGFDAYFTTETSFESAYTTRAHMSSDGGSLDVWHFMKRPTVNIKGYVLDKTYKTPITTNFQIEVIKKGKLEANSDDKGFYKTKLMDKGIYVFKVIADGYEEYFDTLDMTKCSFIENIEKDLYLVPLPKDVSLTGVIYNKKTNEVLGSRIVIASKTAAKQKIRSEDYDGAYRADLPNIGKYKITVLKDGFYTHTEIFEVKNGPDPIEQELNVYLSPKERKIILEGSVTNIKTGGAIEGNVNYTSPSGQKGVLTTDSEGHFQNDMPEPGFYKLYTAIPGYMAANDTVTVYVPFENKKFEKNIQLTPIEVGASVRLNEIYFDVAKADLRPESFPELKRVVEFMAFNKNVTVELSGHTDDRGSEAYNQNLSQHRAESVVKYLIEQGVDQSRIVPKGYGESKPSVPNDSDQHRQFNRRVEFTIIKV